MNKKGFTLIELLAAIVIVCLLAVLASSSVTKTVKNSKSDLYQDQLNLIEKAAKIWASDNIDKLPQDNECKYITLGQLKNYGLLDSNIKNPKNNQLFSDDLKVKITSTLTNISSTLTYEVDSKNTNSCSNVSSCALTFDENNNKKADIGDMITCSTESFHVIENNGETISMLAQYNLDVGYSFIVDENNPWAPPADFKIENPTSLQNENAKAWLADSKIWYGIEYFGETEYYYDNDHVLLIDTDYELEGRKYPFVYGDYKDSNGKQQNILFTHVDAYEKYLIDEGVISAKGTLISYEQLIDLGCSEDGYESDYLCPEEKKWLYTTSYWTGSLHSDVGAWGVCSSGSYEYNICGDGYHYGVRPVINISVNEL